MNNTIVRLPTIREVYEKIQEQLKECSEREDQIREDKNWRMTKQTHPDKHIYEILEYLFRPIEETQVDLEQQLWEFFRLQSKKNEEKQRKPGETDKGLD